MTALLPAVDDVVHLAYGRGYLEVPQHPGSTVVLPHDDAPLADPAAAIREAVRSPLGAPALRDIVSDGDHVVISVCDGTRAQPRAEVLPVLLGEIDSAAADVRVTVLIATGTHRGNTDAELLEMLGAQVLSRCEVVNHDARDASSLVDLGVVGDGVPLRLNRIWVEADVRITSGFVEPHFFAGFSGGPKMVAPGLAGLGTVMVLHDARRIGDELATWGEVRDNPVHRDIRAAAAAAPPHLAVDVLMDGEKRITHVVAGALDDMHDVACDLARAAAMRAVPEPFDVVVTTNSGHPLDQNLYQAVKGMAAAERIVKPGGTIVVAAECSDGLPAHGAFAEVLGAADSPAALLEAISAPGFSVADQWQVQILARVLTGARVLMRSDGLDDATLKRANITGVPDVAEAVADAVTRAGPDARVCYLPMGPQTIPYLM